MKHLKRLVAVAISFCLLAVLIHKVDAQKVKEAISHVRYIPFGIALFLFIPQSLAIAWRWRLIAEPLAALPLSEAARQILASNCLNLVLPSKMGDLAKGVFLYKQGRCELEDGIQIVVFEKLLDLAALSTVMVLGWLFVRRTDWWILGMLALGIFIVAVVYSVYFVRREHSLLRRLLPEALLNHPKAARIHRLLDSGPRVMAMVHADGTRRSVILASSIGIWLLHVLQIYFFFICLNADVGILNVFALMPIAIFAGLLPLTLAGVGTRDWALLAIFRPTGTPDAVLVSVGLFVTLRYVIPAMGGMPFVGTYLTMSREAAGATSARGQDA